MASHAPEPWDEDDVHRAAVIISPLRSSREEIEANARLIAHAPELLAALEGLVKAAINGRGVEPRPISDAVDAIRAARGE